MAVQCAYGFITGSLGLLTDSIHMLFDCAGLGVGLAASIMAKWPPSVRFPYGLGKVDALSGFGNGIFLVLVSFEVLFEAFHRFRDGTKLRRLNELLIVSVLGLIVNLVGLTAFGDAHHGHSHGHGHGHSHEHVHSPQVSLDHKPSNGSLHHQHSHSSLGHKHSISSLQPPSLPSLPQSPLSAPPLTPATAHDSHPDHTHTQDAHSHGDTPHANHHPHSHTNENMQGIFLHVLADTLGSVAVIASTLLAQHTGWSGWDPLASIVVAAMIFLSAIPLITTCARKLMCVLDEGSEWVVRDGLHGVAELRGVLGYHGVRFWVVDGPWGEGREHGRGSHGGVEGGAEGKRVCGVMHVVAAQGASVDDLRERVGMYLRDRGMDVLVQVESEGGGCDCRR